MQCSLDGQAVTGVLFLSASCTYDSILDFGDFSLVLFYFTSVPFDQFLGLFLSEFSLQQRGPYCVLYSVHRTTAASWCFTVQLDPLYSWYCAVMLSVVWTQRSLYHKWWSMENEPSVRKSVLLTFSGRTVLSSRCMYSRVLVPSTWNCSVFIHYGMWVVTWQAVVAISAPSTKSLSLA